LARHRFEWDEAKRRQNVRRHGIDFADVSRSFDRPRIVDYDEAHSSGEDRYRMLGWLDGHVIVVIYTERGSRIRLISARFAEPSEALLYFREFFGEPYDRS
jgi:uncharacterized DUF497 family protein